jgi:hypothetical protein
MKRLLFLIILISVFIFSETVLAQCPFYGVGVVRGKVKMFGSYFGQQNAYVEITGPSAKYFNLHSTYSDATGFYKLRARLLPACQAQNATVSAHYYMVNGGGAPKEYWADHKPVYIRQPNQGEIIRVTRTLRLRYQGSW